MDLDGDGMLDILVPTALGYIYNILANGIAVMVCLLDTYPSSHIRFYQHPWLPANDGTINIPLLFFTLILCRILYMLPLL